MQHVGSAFSRSLASQTNYFSEMLRYSCFQMVGIAGQAFNLIVFLNILSPEASKLTERGGDSNNYFARGNFFHFV